MFKNVYNYMTNIGSDIIYGYIEVKCSNRNCSRVFKFARNNFDNNNINNFCCRMGCALEAFNQMKNNNN